MDIIFHGKPNTHSIYATEEINPSLKKKITDVFFETRGGIPSDKALVVETYFWQQKWYSVYTFSWAKLKGNEGRPDSYFSISLIFPDVFLLLTSAVYQCLEDTYKKLIEGKVISNVGKYLIQDFTDKQYFESLITHIQTNFANLHDPLDNSFSAKRSNNEIRYNLQDCDALTFLQELRENGRIIVAEGDGFPPKCSAKELAQKEQILSNLSDQLKKKESELAAANSTLDNAKNDINKKVTALEKERDGYKKSAEDSQKKQNAQENLLNAIQNELDDLVSKIRALLPSTNKSVAKPNPDPSVDVVEDAKNFDKYARFLPFVNCFLLLTCICILLIGYISFNKPDEEVKTLKAQVTQLKEENMQKEGEITSLKDEIRKLREKEVSQTGALSTEETSGNSSIGAENDVDCNIEVFNKSGSPIDKEAKVQRGTSVVIKWNPKEGYQWHSANNEINDIMNGSVNNGTAAITINSDILLFYRRQDRNRRNENNKVHLTIK